MHWLLFTSLVALSMGCAARAPVAYPFQPAVAQPVGKAKLVAIAPQLDTLLLEKFNAAKATAMVAGIVLDAIRNSEPTSTGPPVRGSRTPNARAYTSSPSSSARESPGF